jgi:predicted nucleotidyltransferase
MRLNKRTQSIIHNTAADFFGLEATVYLFGSRTDDSAKGGDIDLYIETDQPLENRASAAARFSASLQRQLGDQKIDVIVADPQTPRLPIHDAARREGIRL